VPAAALFGGLMITGVSLDVSSAVTAWSDEFTPDPNGVFNLSRELRLLGVTTYEPNRVRILPELWSADDRESAVRQ